MKIKVLRTIEEISRVDTMRVSAAAAENPINLPDLGTANSESPPVSSPQASVIASATFIDHGRYEYNVGLNVPIGQNGQIGTIVSGNNDIGFSRASISAAVRW